MNKAQAKRTLSWAEFLVAHDEILRQMSDTNKAIAELSEQFRELNAGWVPAGKTSVPTHNVLAGTDVRIDFAETPDQTGRVRLDELHQHEDRKLVDRLQRGKIDPAEGES